MPRPAPHGGWRWRSTRPPPSGSTSRSRVGERWRAPALAHDSVLHRQPITTLDDHLGRGPAGRGPDRAARGIRAARRSRRPTTPSSTPTTSGSGRRSCGPRRSVTSTPSSATCGRCGSVAAAKCPRPGTACRSSTSRTPPRFAAPTTRSGRRAARQELDYELEVGALIDTPVRDLPAERGLEAIGGYFVLNDWSARDLQRDETTVRLGPAKGKDFATSIGPWLVTPDELADAWAPARPRLTSR